MKKHVRVTGITICEQYDYQSEKRCFHPVILKEDERKPEYRTATGIIPGWCPLEDVG